MFFQKILSVIIRHLGRQPVPGADEQPERRPDPQSWRTSASSKKQRNMRRDKMTATPNRSANDNTV